MDDGAAPARLLPLGPFPPWTPARNGDTQDIGALLRDQLLQRRALWGPHRRLLQSRLAQAIEASQWTRAAELLEMWLQTWPIGALVDPAISEWMAQPSAECMVVLARASELACAALGWRTQPGLPWPDPPVEWLSAQLRGSTAPWFRRGDGDGGELLAEALGRPAEGDLGWPRELLPVERVRGEQLGARRGELAARIVRGELGAVALTSPLPPSPQARLAMGELRMEGPHQRAYETWGPAGLRVSGHRTLAQLLGAAPAGEAGSVLVACGDCLLAPGTPAGLRRGQVETVGWLLWEGPFAPVPVHPIAVDALRALDGVAGSEQVASQLGLGVEQAQAVLDALVSVGAATAA